MPLDFEIDNKAQRKYREIAFDFIFGCTIVLNLYTILLFNREGRDATVYRSQSILTGKGWVQRRRTGRRSWAGLRPFLATLIASPGRNGRTALADKQPAPFPWMARRVISQKFIALSAA